MMGYLQPKTYILVLPSQKKKKKNLFIFIQICYTQVIINIYHLSNSKKVSLAFLICRLKIWKDKITQKRHADSKAIQLQTNDLLGGISRNFPES